jgi:hypothetical protein
MNGRTVTYRPEFEAALKAFARASETMRRKGFEAPVLVGGAAAELYSGSAITTGDFDIVRQARTLFGLYPDADLAYLERRVREETMGECGVEVCKS